MSMAPGPGEGRARQHALLPKNEMLPILLQLELSLEFWTSNSHVLCRRYVTQTLHYKRSHFVTNLPLECLYSPSHVWLARQEGDRWRVGFTKFATRMLGEMVDCGFEPAAGSSVTSGQIIGWVEGFKAISDIFCVVDGRFCGGNPALKEKIALIDKEP